MASYKTDFEEERRDRKSAHSKMADMQRRLSQLEGRTAHERATYNHEVDELERCRDAIREQLRIKDQELLCVTEELRKHKQILSELELVHQRRIQEVREELQAKASQVKQYAKENETLKQQKRQLKEQVCISGPLVWLL